MLNDWSTESSSLDAISKVCKLCKGLRTDKIRERGNFCWGLHGVTKCWVESIKESYLFRTVEHKTCSCHGVRILLYLSYLVKVESEKNQETVALERAESEKKTQKLTNNMTTNMTLSAADALFKAAQRLQSPTNKPWPLPLSECWSALAVAQAEWALVTCIWDVPDTGCDCKPFNSAYGCFTFVLSSLGFSHGFP